MNIVICPLSPGLFSGPTVVSGATTHIIGFANALATIPGVRVRLLYPRLADSSVFSREVAVIPVDIPRCLQKRLPAIVRGMLWNLCAMYLGFREIVGRLGRRGYVDVLYIRFSASVVLPLLLLKPFLPSTLFLFEINTPASISAANRGSAVQWLARMVDRLTLIVCDGAFVVSEDLRAILVGQHGQWAEEKLFLNVNGVDPERFRPLDAPDVVRAYRESLGVAADDCVVGYVGKAVPHHRLDLLAKIVGETTDVPLRMVVAGNAEAVSRDELERLGRGRVILLGQIPYEQVPLFLNACDILILPHGPSYKGLLHQSPIKLFEYMAVGKPVIARKIGQIERVITHDENGLLFGQDDDRQLKEYLVKLSKDTELRDRLGRAARDTVMSNYTWSHNARRVLETIQYATG